MIVARETCYVLIFRVSNCDLYVIMTKCWFGSVGDWRASQICGRFEGTSLLLFFFDAPKSFWTNETNETGRQSYLNIETSFGSLRGSSLTSSH